MKHPNKWTSENIDEILEIGNQLCLDSLTVSHMHQSVKELKRSELSKYCVIGKLNEFRIFIFILTLTF